MAAYGLLVLSVLCSLPAPKGAVREGKCGAQRINAPFERQNSRFTLMFEGYAMMILAGVPRRKASKLLRCNEKSFAFILAYWVNRVADKQDLSDVSKLALDETSKQRGHAICEGINSLLQAAKRKARGFNTFDGFRAMIFLVGGRLKLDVPSPF